ncbi:ParB/RepB/Spo0J family partition protein [Paracoccus aestuariivivens]|uniref:Chromosome partitioning protein ParB n=1 Tax=Paracoccus aestuariivivens TaxID=1820333 RepID=A0A6L6J6Y7_9RHOB|nr:ParB N-terminal domain-containing protein [Paracoccus aestuariivivens]MTH76925.1 chromosome partitioning protein ParB [Paracoccus aestuariivivens]
MSGKNKFGFGPLDAGDVSPRKRDVGPMGAAVREAASSLNESSENLVEQRRLNAADAKAFRLAQEEGRVLISIPLDEIRTDDLPRDRLDLSAVSTSDEMEELKASIRERGQKEPIEVFLTEGGYQLKKGWRRLNALQQLRQESGDVRFAKAVARVSEGPASRIDLYIDMVEENVIREDLSFAEMAQVAIAAANDADMEGQGADELVGRIYASLHKMKRSYIRSFVYLLEVLGEDLKFPKAVARNLGVEVARKLQSNPALSANLCNALLKVEGPEDQAEILRRFATEVSEPPSEKAGERVRQKNVKYEFHVGSAKVTARRGECRILSDVDFLSVDRRRLQKAIEAFQTVLDGA